MKKSTLAATLTTASFLSIGVALNAQAATAHAGTQTVYRDYNNQNGDHLYTSSHYEWTQVGVHTYGWQEDSVTFTEPTTGGNIYRVYNPISGEHFLTPSAYEKNSLVSIGWRYEGISFHSGGTTPVYRLYNPNATNSGGHLYTASAYEKSQLQKVGWKYEGIAWYAISSENAETQDNVVSSNPSSNTTGNVGTPGHLTPQEQAELTDEQTPGDSNGQYGNLFN